MLAKNPIIRKFVDGTFLNDVFVKNMKFILFIAGLGIVAIYFRLRAEKLYIEKDTIKEEIKELRAEAIIKASKLMFVSKEFEVKRLIDKKNLGLEIADCPATIIVIDTTKNTADAGK